MKLAGPRGQWNAFGIAVDSIRTHPLRTSLTLVGIVIGVASVVLVGAAINGMSAYAKDTTTKAFGSESLHGGADHHERSVQPARVLRQSEA